MFLGRARRIALNLKRRCLIGSELRFMEHMYYYKTSPQGKVCGKKFRIIFEAGLYQIWINTFLPTYIGGRGAIHAKTPTQILEANVGPEALQLEGKLGYDLSCGSLP